MLPQIAVLKSADSQLSGIDRDQGHSGASAADREGFQTQVIELRLARNSTA
jgi:hypothetical protein